MTQDVLGSLAALPTRVRTTTCEDKTDVSTIIASGMYETVCFEPDGSQSEVKRCGTFTQMMLDHDTFVAQHGGRRCA